MDDRDYLPLSWLSQVEYCRRRAALLLNERVWGENEETAKGRYEHMRVHDKRIERRGDRLKLYECTVFSETLGIWGKCDCIEAERWDQGCRIKAADFPVRLFPIEYKHGSVREEQSYMIQLCAQAMCLEEMLLCPRIGEGCLYYGETARREHVPLTADLRDTVATCLKDMHRMAARRQTPKVTPTRGCNACSLKDVCLPFIQQKRSAAAYIAGRIREDAPQGGAPCEN